MISKPILVSNLSTIQKKLNQLSVVEVKQTGCYERTSVQCSQRCDIGLWCDVMNAAVRIRWKTRCPSLHSIATHLFNLRHALLIHHVNRFERTLYVYILQLFVITVFCFSFLYNILAEFDTNHGIYYKNHFDTVFYRISNPGPYFIKVKIFLKSGFKMNWSSYVLANSLNFEFLLTLMVILFFIS